MRSLTSRLVATAVALVAVVSLLVVALSTLAMRAYLTDRLDEQVRQTLGRVLAGEPPQPSPGDPGEGPLHRDDRFGPGRRDDRFGQGRRDDRFGQGEGTLRAVFDRAGTTYVADRITDDPEPVPLADGDLAVLSRLPADGRVRAVDLPVAGEYRLVLVRDQGLVVAAGLPSAEVGRTLGSLLGSGLLLAGVGVAGAAAAGVALVRRQLRPLREVAGTAHEVAALPLASGEIAGIPRVPERPGERGSEVGQVASALNRMLDHVEASLAARHRSEQQVRQFVADASHELRTPLATIAGYAELARRHPDDQQAMRTALAKVEAESDRMTALVEDLLLLARLDAGRPLAREPVDLSRMLVEAVSDARVVAPGHRWRLDLPEAPVEVTGDPARLRQAVTNLLANAGRHTPEGTTVTVTARPGRLVVADDGPGFPADLLRPTPAVAFERFARGDGARTRGAGGTGLGLALVSAIVTAHGGTVSLSSRPGDTRVEVTLPGAQPG